MNTLYNEVVVRLGLERIPEEVIKSSLSNTLKKFNRRVDDILRDVTVNVAEYQSRCGKVSDLELEDLIGYSDLEVALNLTIINALNPAVYHTYYSFAKSSAEFVIANAKELEEETTMTNVELIEKYEGIKSRIQAFLEELN